jgi:hypothetical protein
MGIFEDSRTPRPCIITPHMLVSKSCVLRAGATHVPSMNSPVRVLYPQSHIHSYTARSSLLLRLPLV